jgi:hypothetical protein
MTMTDTTETPKSELHTYPDGSAVVGTPPFPKKSPLQIAAESMERVGAPAEPGAVSNVITADHVTATESISKKR